MIHPVIGAIIGGFITYLFCKIFDIETQEKSAIVRLPSKGQMLIGLGIIFGTGVGFGYSTYKLTNDKWKIENNSLRIFFYYIL